MLVKGLIAQELKIFMDQQRATPQEDPDAAIKAFCDKMEEMMFKVVKSMTITITPGQIAVIAPPPSGVGSNPSPIVIRGTQIT